MEITSAEFVISLPEYRKFPGMGLAQIAVAGKSNVGKSSLINSLTRRNGLAKVSGTPGKTRLLNIFLLNKSFHLVDLPGYGFARVDKKEKERWAGMMDGFFQQSDFLRLTLHLVDIRHEPTADDLTMNEFLRGTGQPFVVVATKADKVSRAQRAACIQLICRSLQVQPWQVIPYSSQTGDGRALLLKTLETALQS